MRWIRGLRDEIAAQPLKVMKVVHVVCKSFILTLLPPQRRTRSCALCLGQEVCWGQFFIGTWQIRYHLFLIIFVVISTFLLLLLWQREYLNYIMYLCIVNTDYLISYTMARFAIISTSIATSFPLTLACLHPVIPSQWTNSAKCFVIPSVVRIQVNIVICSVNTKPTSWFTKNEIFRRKYI